MRKDLLKLGSVHVRPLVLVDLHEGTAKLHEVTVLDADVDHLPVDLGHNLVHELHRLHDAEGVTLLDLGTFDDTI